MIHSSSRFFAAASVAVLLATGCHVSLGKSEVVVDGVRLAEHHVEFLSLTELPAALVLESALGDIELVYTQGSTSIEVELYEAFPNDAYAEFDGGTLRAISRSGEPAAIGKVTIRTSQSFASLQLATGMGDIEVVGVSVTGAIDLRTGLGDVLVRGSAESDESESEAARSIFLSSSMGDVQLIDTHCGTLEASSGLGDIDIRAVTAREATLSSGLGDIDVSGSNIGHLEASTGLGDVDCRNSVIAESKLSSGLGSTSER